MILCQREEGTPKGEKKRTKGLIKRVGSRKAYGFLLKKRIGPEVEVFKRGGGEGQRGLWSESN